MMNPVCKSSGVSGRRKFAQNLGARPVPFMCSRLWAQKFLAVMICFCLSLTASASTEFHLDPINGSDTNAGTLNLPWKSFANISNYDHEDFQPPQWKKILQGDKIILHDGVYDEMIHPSGDGGAAGKRSYVAYFKGKEEEDEDNNLKCKKSDDNNWFSIEAFPGANPILDPKHKGLGLRISNSKNWALSGFTVRNAYVPGVVEVIRPQEGGGIKLSNITNVIVKNIEVYDTDGRDNDNPSGLHCLNCCNIEISESRLP